MPLPTAPDAEIYGYAVGESMALALPALVHLVSATGLAELLLAVRRAVPAVTDGPAGRWANAVGVLAVAALPCVRRARHHTERADEHDHRT